MRSLGLTATSILLAGWCAVAATGAPLIPLPFLRGGSATAVVATKSTPKRQSSKTSKRQRQRRDGVNPIQMASKNLSRGLGKVGDKMQRDANDFGKNVGREWNKITTNTQKFVADVPKILTAPLRRKSLKTCRRLDDVCHAFSSVQRGNGEVDTAQLLKACKAHLAFMKSGGSSLRLVAKDLESNMKKAERVFKKSSKESRSLSMLLESERDAGAHNGSELGEKSAAMGLLWIRRSLAFQSDLYSSLAARSSSSSASVRAPRDAAREAYARHLLPFHGWALRRVFPASLSQMPDRDTFVAKFAGVGLDELNEEYDRMIAAKLRGLVDSWDPLIARWEAEYDRLGLEDTRKV